MEVDDIDEIPFGEKSASAKEPKSQVSVVDLLEILDGYDYLHGCIVVFTSNHPDRLDQRILRSGRIDLRLRIGYPTRAVVESMFMYNYGKSPDGLPEESPISTADIMHRVISVNDDYDSAVLAFHQLLKQK